MKLEGEFRTELKLRLRIKQMRSLKTWLKILALESQTLTQLLRTFQLKIIFKEMIRLEKLTLKCVLLVQQLEKNTSGSI
jgi:hypothetical protein